MVSAIAVPSAAMQRRITSHLENGITPSVRGNRVMLKDIVLIKANGERAPAATEAERQAAQRNISLNIAFWDKEAATERKGNQILAYDTSGRKHMVARRYRDERVVTKQGRRFYAEAPQTEWIIHIPVVFRRTLENGQYSYFNPRTIDMTDLMMTAFSCQAARNTDS